MEKKKKLPLVRILLLVFFMGLFAFAAFQYFRIEHEDQQSAAIREDLALQAVTVITPSAPAAAPEEENAGAPELPALPPISGQEAGEGLTEASCQIPIRVDFDLLQAQYPDIVGWLYCEQNLLNHPVVQAEDNDYYLYRLPDGTQNPAGTLFMDFRCLSDVSDRNTIIYGHNMRGGAMFGFLANYRNPGYYERHPTMWYLTPEQAYRLDLIAGIVTPSDSSTFDVFNTDEELQTHLARAVKESTFQSGVNLEEVSQIITLSTCTYDYAIARYVIIANLVPAPYPPME